MDSAFDAMVFKGIVCAAPYLGLLVLFVAGHWLIKRLARRWR